MASPVLPPLPESQGALAIPARPYEPAWVSSSDAWDDDGMRAYGLACYRAGLEAARDGVAEAWVRDPAMSPAIVLTELLEQAK